jgi:predicted CoA-substrate-specific enzyme activase
MGRTSECRVASDPGVFDGWNIGAVSIKRVRFSSRGAIESAVRRHGGDPASTIRAMVEEAGPVPAGACVTGAQSSTLLSLPYFPESICTELAAGYLGLSPDIVLSMGGESVVAYCMADGVVRRTIASNRCAAGSGEFLVQQFSRMGLDLEAGIAEAQRGRRVPLASRCSVHCKSDATHKLNKGECTPADIARSLLAELASKVAALIAATGWRQAQVLLVGGLARSALLLQDIRALLPGAPCEVPAECGYFEALGAAVAARNAGACQLPEPDRWLQPPEAGRFPARPALRLFSEHVRRVQDRGLLPAHPVMHLILGVDAGSTTTKAVLLDRDRLGTVAACYLRTHGNPVRAAFECLTELRRQIDGFSHHIVQVAATGSGREMVSVYLDGCLVFNEILAHARAAREVAPDVDTLFEIGGQDAKFVALQAGIPVDYAMNDGCSAGTGSFLEEAAGSDMRIPVDRIGALALASANPVALGERCAAFINSDVRSALQQGVPHGDVLAGLVYAIVDNFLSRVVGTRHIGRTVVLQGGVALNPAVAPAVAALAGVDVVVPAGPELMGAEGAARMALDLLAAGTVSALDRALGSFGAIGVETKPTFVCPSCENRCEVQRVLLGNRTYPFGGLCSKWEMTRRSHSLRRAEGTDLVALRQQLMFRTFASSPPARARGRIGLPLALTTYELYPLYSRFLRELGYQVVLSRPGFGSRRTGAPMCYPGELMHAAVDDLLAQDVDFVFLPYLREFSAPRENEHGYVCPVTQDVPGVIRSFFEPAADRILTPEMGLAPQLAAVTAREAIEAGARLGVSAECALDAWAAGLRCQGEFQRGYRAAVEEKLARLEGPAVILIGRPYVAYAPEVNLSVPRKISTRGFTVIPADALPAEAPPNTRNVWHFTQTAMAAIQYARESADRYVCDLSCFSCGPDAIMYHRLRRELDGAPFCFLEIDSHTAHAGIETRIGAFLDIVEARRTRIAPSSAARNAHPAPARLEHGPDRTWIVTGGGRRLAMNAPEVVHVPLSDGPEFAHAMLTGCYAVAGSRVMSAPATSDTILQRARRVCSGRECLPFLSMMGKVVSHLETRPPGEVTVFHLLEQEGPCQIGAWYDAAPAIFEQLGEQNAVVAWPEGRNNYLGQGDRFASMTAAALLLSDILAEIRSSLTCLAKDPAAALDLLEAVERELITASKSGLLAIDRALREASPRLAQVELRQPVDRTPRVLLFGGINRVFVDAPVRRFFEQRGILAKTTEWSEFLCFLQSEDIVRLGFSHGQLAPAEQCSMPALLGDLCRRESRTAAVEAVRARVNISLIERVDRRWRRLAEESGLLFSPYVPFADIQREGHKHVSLNGYTEAPMTIGRYAALLNQPAFDGYVGIGAFNCAPANTASAVIQSLSLRTDAPYAIIEADGGDLTASQLRQLETVAAQCVRRRESAAAARSGR